MLRKTKSAIILAAGAGLLASSCGIASASVTQPPAATRAGAVSIRDWRTSAVEYADAHWAWSDENDKEPRVGNGANQYDFQCAEFVARSLAAAGLIPGLNADAPQSDYNYFKARNSKTYDLLLISDSPGHRSLYDFLRDFGIGTDIGDKPGRAQPGDVVVSFDKSGSGPVHTGLIAQAGDGTRQPVVDAHNNARLRCTLDRYSKDTNEPSIPHIVKIAPIHSS
ncbi:amidase domain-containing protein [Streptomyces vinaceus]|uniref:amidase domain-containing protein n=1 Tax=Streptomyces vinaceus TaxID=1960 RepID=UPI0035DFD236